MRTMEAWTARVVQHHAEAVARGEHDDECEWDASGFWICHCSKRRREAAGFTEPPTEELYFPPPACPRCGEDLEFDDHFSCPPCRLSWTDDRTAYFTDDYGDISRCSEHGIRGHVICQSKETP